MNPDYINLVCTDSQHFLNMNVIMASSPEAHGTARSLIPEPAPISPSPCCEEYSPDINLVDFDKSVTDGEDFVDRACIQIINQIKAFDKSNVDKYTLGYRHYNNHEAYVTISSMDNPTTELIQRFSFNVGVWDDGQYGRVAKIYVNGLFINQKYSDVGSTLLDILKNALRSLVSLAQLNMGSISLFSVETAVLFYIKQGFVVRDLIEKKEPQQSVYSLSRMIQFAMQENNIEIMKKYAGVTQDNFMEFIEYLIKNTKYGKFFAAYFESKENKDAMEEAVMKSRFIANLFDTNMIWQFIRDPSRPRVNLKQLTM